MELFKISLLACFMTLLQAFITADAQMCTMGFPITVSDCSGSNCVTKRGTFIVPDMRFTCSGTVTGWRVAGEHILGGNTNSALIIWRERSSESETYDNIDRIELGACAGQHVETGMNNVYECTLNQGDRVSVQPGDIIGIETPGPKNGRFRLYFDSSGGPMNYIFNSRAPQTINLDDATESDNLVPQISLTVTASTTQIPMTEMTDGSTITSGPSSTEAATSDRTTDGGTITSRPSSTEAESIATSDRTTEMTDGSTISSGPTSTEAESIVTSDRITEITDEGIITSGPSSTEAESIVTSDRTTEMTDGGTITSRPSSTEAATSDRTTDGGTITSRPSSTEAESITTSGRTTEMIDGGTTTSGPVSTETFTTSEHTTTQITTTGSPRQGDSANNPQDKDNSDTSIAIVGAIVGVLLVFISVLLLIIILRRQRSGQKLLAASDNNNVINPVYNGNVEVYEPDHTGPIGICNITVDYDLGLREYEDIDIPRPNHISQPPDLRFNDYSQPRDALINAGYEIPLRNLAPPVPLAVPHYHEIETLYVPTQEQRKTLPANGAIYAAIKKAQQCESGPAPELFEEEETYWEPAVDTSGLIRQLSSKKYREILRPRLQIVSHLGSGQFGTVNKGIWQSPMGAMDVAVKQLQSGASEEEKVKFLQEAAINGQFRHPNVIKLMGVVTIGEPAMIVLELLTNGDLHKYLLNLRPSPGEILPSNMPQLLLKFYQQIASGMEHLAKKSFVHRDLAARNILVSEGKICKISDFGMSRNIMNEDYYISHGGRVPVKWTAPEAINYKKYSTASDVWSFGCVMYEIWSLGQKPFQDYHNLEVIQMIDDGYRLPPPPGLTKELYKIMIQCWHPDRSSRPTFPQLVEMLSRADFELFVWEEEDLRNSDPQVKLIGAPLELAKNLYHELQRVYFSS